VRGGGKTIAALAALAVAFALAAVAHAELTERGDLFVRFDGGIAPRELPRASRGAVSVSVEGTIKTLSGEEPPPLRRISIAINRGGSIDTRGLPRCTQAQLQATSREQALESCGGALVGRGHYVAAYSFPDQNAFPLRGPILAFNAIVNGQRAILAHVYATSPFPATRIVVFRIRRSRGTFGTVLDAALPPSLNRNGYLKEIRLNLHRVYEYRGRKRSYLGAECAAPAPLTIGIFPFARVSMGFADGRKLSSTLIRTCKVRKQPR
jgi:hypothetical protein